MIFATENAIRQIISGEKTQTRRLVKEGEHPAFDIGMEINTDCVFTKDAKIKWQVGKTYAVQSGRGRNGLFYCPICFKKGKKEYLLEQDGAKGKDLTKIDELCWYKPYHHMKPLRIRITGIKKEKLLDIQTEDVIKEGFENQATFLKAFCEINKIRHCWQFPPSSGYKFEKKMVIGLDSDWFGCDKNPFVWVLDFSKVEE